MKFGVMIHLSPPNLTGNQKLKNFKIQDGGHLENRKPRYLTNRLADFNEILHDGT